MPAAAAHLVTQTTQELYGYTLKTFGYTLRKQSCMAAYVRQDWWQKIQFIQMHYLATL